ncbi:MAG: HAD family hydrolase [Chloroflexi bacterium]|nr:HAD family hydrolase [Chloroflexota bacterium]
MKKPIRVVFFDLGNTLLYDKDSWEKLYQEADDVLWKSLHTFGVQASPAEIYGDHETLFHYYYNLRQNELDEPGIAVILKQLLKRKNILLPEERLHSALQAMYRVTQANWYEEEDAAATLEVLKERGFKLGIISNGADDENTQTLIDKAHLRPFFEYIISSAAFGKRKPHPSIFRAALNHFHVRAEETVMVGDTYDADIVGAHAAGMNTIWITRRVRERVADSKVRPDAVVKSLSEIPALLST